MSALPDSPKSPLRADAARNRAALLDAARAVFAEEGLDAPITAIVRRAGCAKGTFFRHFATKDELIAGLVNDRLEQMRGVAAAIARDHEPGWAALCAMVEGFQELIAPDRSFMQALVHRDGHRLATAAGAEELDAQVQAILEAGQAAGEVRPDVTHTDIQLVAMGVTGATAPLHDTDPLLGRRLLRIVLDGFRAGVVSDLGAPPASAERIQAAKRAGRLPGRTGPGCGAPG